MLRGYVMLSCSVVLLALFASVQGRAVNISNTWVLPEEGFPVFYRYFRDRISWYEADAVCQFHHANLVTVDTTAQYDAVRAYLKELDISSAVWVGLIRSNPDGDFTWTDYRGLSGEGYWSSAPDTRAAPLCAAADPAADYRWEARACGGPTVASFICELPVPQWALGNQGCMVRALPALTVLYLPETAAIQLTADCGLAGTKRVQCTGNVKREDLLRNLSCAENEDLSSTPSEISAETTWSVITDTEYTTTDEDTTNEVTTEENITTETAEETHTSPKSTAAPIFTVKQTQVPSKQQIIINKLNSIYSQKNVNLDLLHNNNLQSNDIPKLGYNENFLTVEQTEKLEDEKHMHHKMLHDELARHGNFETIFTQPTDHFVPPLVMAKSKMSDDMTVLSLAEKHAQQLAEQRFAKHNLQNDQYGHLNVENIKSVSKMTTDKPKEMDTTHKPLSTTEQPVKVKDTLKNDKIKLSHPKKYKEKYDDLKGKKMKMIDNKLIKIEKSTEASSQTEISFKSTETIIIPVTETEISKSEEESSMDLTVMLKELGMEDSRVPHYSNYSDTVPIVDISANNTSVNKSEPEISSRVKIETKHETVAETQTESLQNIPMTHEVVKITIINDNRYGTSPTPTVFEITTRVPELKDNTVSENKISTITTNQPNRKMSTVNSIATINDFSISQTNSISSTSLKVSTTTNDPETTSINALDTTTHNPKSKSENLTPKESTSITSFTEEALTTKPEVSTKIPNSTLPQNITQKDIEAVTTAANIPYSISKDKIENFTNHTHTIEEILINSSDVETTDNSQHDQEATTTTVDMEYNVTKDKIDVFNYTGSHEDDYAKNWTDSLETIDDFQSPLLSAANEPLHRPNRSRRPAQPPSRINKFNPFRILG